MEWKCVSRAGLGQKVSHKDWEEDQPGGLAFFCKQLELGSVATRKQKEESHAVCSLHYFVKPFRV